MKNRIPHQTAPLPDFLLPLTLFLPAPQIFANYNFHLQKKTTKTILARIMPRNFDTDNFDLCENTWQWACMRFDLSLLPKTFVMWILTFVSVHYVSFSCVIIIHNWFFISFHESKVNYEQKLAALFVCLKMSWPQLLLVRTSLLTTNADRKSDNIDRFSEETIDGHINRIIVDLERIFLHFCCRPKYFSTSKCSQC